MKKVLTAVLSMALLAGCAGTAAPKKAATKKLKIGIGSVSNLKSKELKNNKGSVQFNTTIATVVLEGDVIKYLSFDVAQNTSTFDGAGKFTSNHSKTLTKKEKKDDYGMKKISKIGKEWYEQNAALDKWFVGKTKTDVENMKTEVKNNHVVSTDKDLLSGATFGVDEFQKTIVKAFANTTEIK